MGLRHPVHQELVSGKFDLQKVPLQPMCKKKKKELKKFDLQKVPLQPMCLDCIFVLNTWR